jgi:UDP-N-acetylglucosamine pyrophosphorylase
MAAGKGTRMQRDDIPKVCNQVNGRPLIKYVVDQAKSIQADKIVCIIGHMKEKVMETLAGEPVVYAHQDQQLGTGHAVQQTAPLLKDFHGDVIVLSGDVPLLKASTLQALLQRHHTGNFSCTVLTALAPDPTGYGRVVRESGVKFDRIVEHKDASEEIRKINEINSGIYVFDADPLFRELPKLDNVNAQGEYYLTEVLTRFRSNGLEVGVEICETFSEIQGINTVSELQAVDELIRKSVE